VAWKALALRSLRHSPIRKSTTNLPSLPPVRACYTNITPVVCNYVPRASSRFGHIYLFFTTCTLTHVIPFLDLLDFAFYSHLAHHGRADAQHPAAARIHNCLCPGYTMVPGKACSSGHATCRRAPGGADKPSTHRPDIEHVPATEQERDRLGLAEKWRECGSHDGEGIEWAGTGSCKYPSVWIGIAESSNDRRVNRLTVMLIVFEASSVVPTSSS
jgi:hypothetical protein